MLIRFYFDTISEDFDINALTKMNIKVSESEASC